MHRPNRLTPSSMNAETRPLKILVMDDDPIVLETASLLLDEEGHEVVTGDQLPELYRLVEEHPPDALIIDVSFGTGNSLGAVRNLRRRYPANRLAVLLSTGHDVPAAILKELDATLVMKPWRIATLRETLEKSALVHEGI